MKQIQTYPGVYMAELANVRTEYQIQKTGLQLAIKKKKNLLKIARDHEKSIQLLLHDLKNKIGFTYIRLDKTD